MYVYQTCTGICYLEGFSWERVQVLELLPPTVSYMMVEEG